MFRMRWVVAVVVMATGGTAVAEIINVPGDQPTIQAAINAADDGDQIIVAPNIYSETITIDKGLTLRSSAGPEVTIIDAEPVWSGE